MIIKRASHLGMCFGVRDALEMAKKESTSGPLTILGELAHHPSISQTLTGLGIGQSSHSDPLEPGRVMITAHGTSNRARAMLRSKGHQILEGTCPLVHHAHEVILSLVAQCCHPVIIGQRDHVEVRGLTGDLDEFDVILRDEDVKTLRQRPRFGVISQTTQPIHRVHHLTELMRLQFPNSEILFRNTVCKPTRERQEAALELAQTCDMIVVIGGKNSNNTRELVNTCSPYCDRIAHVESVNDLRRCWFYGVQTVGLTAGTSTPDIVIDEVETWLKLNCEGENEQNKLPIK